MLIMEPVYSQTGRWRGDGFKDQYSADVSFKDVTYISSNDLHIKANVTP